MSPVAQETKSVANTKDGRSEGRMQKYQDFWDSELKKEEKVHTANRLEHYAEVINGAHLLSLFFGFVKLISG
ncbi:hypothetical protein NLI96_g7870 [Meripilus lineatus]|uniref:Uncharacterized protein n=1 Tax=Meripilus lineatus TaxID=2056292 RepID=A0AAD5YCJ4_9APHY|nr:hypothetical protein NLI96_g7870 [Physisporinus lineatus]